MQAKAAIESGTPVLESGLAMDPPVALTIAGSDPSGGAGLQADLKTFHQFGVYGAAVPTLVTVQNTVSVEAVVPLDADLVRRQIDCVHSDLGVAAAKTGALGSVETVGAVADWALRCEAWLVVDPVIASTHGRALTDTGVVDAITSQLLPACWLVTPNMHEAAVLAGIEVRDLPAMREAAARIGGRGARHVLIKGGHLDGSATDVLWTNGEMREFRADRVESRNTHGTGCTYSAAITALLAQGHTLFDAVGRAKRFVTEAIRTAPALGGGCGPLNHHASTDLSPVAGAMIDPH